VYLGYEFQNLKVITYVLRVLIEDCIYTSLSDYRNDTPANALAFAGVSLFVSAAQANL
jgi:hypothetical protein